MTYIREHRLFIAFVACFLIIVVSAMGFFCVRAYDIYQESKKSAIRDQDAFRDGEVTTTGQESRLPVSTYLPKRIVNTEEMDTPTSSAAVVLDVASDTILYGKNEREQRAIASTTKLLSAMIVVDEIDDLASFVTIPEGVTNIEGTRVGCKTSYSCAGVVMEAGEELSVHSLLVAMLLASANDAATTLAQHVGGGEEGFAKLMNARIAALGMRDSTFCRPSGLELDDLTREAACVSTAHDIGRVATALYRDEKYAPIRAIIGEREMTVTSRDGRLTHTLATTNTLLGESARLIGGKTGFTPRAGLSFVGIAEHEETGHQIVTVTLDDLERFPTTEQMIDWTYTNFIWE